MKNKFEWVEKMRDTELDWKAKAVGGYLAEKGNMDGTHIWPSKATIAKKTSTSKGTVDAAIKTLMAEGWLVLVSEGGSRPGEKRTSNVYELAIPVHHLTGLPADLVSSNMQLGQDKHATGSSGDPYQSLPVPNTNNFYSKNPINIDGELLIYCPTNKQWIHEGAADGTDKELV